MRPLAHAARTLSSEFPISPQASSQSCVKAASKLYETHPDNADVHAGPSRDRKAHQVLQLSIVSHLQHHLLVSMAARDAVPPLPTPLALARTVGVPTAPAGGRVSYRYRIGLVDATALFVFLTSSEHYGAQGTWRSIPGALLHLSQDDPAYLSFARSACHSQSTPRSCPLCTGQTSERVN